MIAYRWTPGLMGPIADFARSYGHALALGRTESGAATLLVDDDVAALLYLYFNGTVPPLA